MNREEAIKTLRELWRETYDPWYKETYDLAIEALQTDIVHCEECEWWQKQDDSLQGRCAKYEFYPTGRYFCAGGERREDKDHERAIEQIEHDMLYEQTYNAEDGSM